MANIKHILKEYLQEQMDMKPATPFAGPPRPIDWSGGQNQGGILNDITKPPVGPPKPPTPPIGGGGGIDWGGGQNQGGILKPIVDADFRPDFSGGSDGIGGGNNLGGDVPDGPQFGVNVQINSDGEIGPGGKFVLPYLGNVKPIKPINR